MVQTLTSCITTFKLFNVTCTMRIINLPCRIVLIIIRNITKKCQVQCLGQSKTQQMVVIIAVKRQCSISSFMSIPIKIIATTQPQMVINSYLALCVKHCKCFFCYFILPTKKPVKQMHPHFYRWGNWGLERLNHLLAQDYISLHTREFQPRQVQAFNDCAMLTISWEQEHCIFSFLEFSIVSGNLSLDTLLSEYNMYSISLHATCCPDFFLYSQVISALFDSVPPEKEDFCLFWGDIVLKISLYSFPFLYLNLPTALKSDT